MSAYKLFTFDLATPRDKRPIGDRATPVSTVAVIQLPAGTSAFLRFGQGNDDIPLLNQGMEFRPCPTEKDGVYLTNSAGGGDLKLLVSFEEASVGVSN